MASSEDKNFIAACFRGRSEAQMSLGNRLGTITTAALPLNSQPIRRHDEGLEGESLVVVRKLGRKGLLNIDLNVPPPEAPDCELTAEDSGGNGPETLPPPPPPPADVSPYDSAKKAGISDEGELNFNCEMRTTEMEENKGRNRRWTALIGVAESALREKKEEEIRKRKRGVSQEAELGGEAAATRKKNFSGQQRQSLVEGWNREMAAEAVVVRSTRGRAVAMPSKYRDSLLGAAAAAAVELPRHNKNGKSGTVFCTKRRSR